MIGFQNNSNSRLKIAGWKKRTSALQMWRTSHSCWGCNSSCGDWKTSPNVSTTIPSWQNDFETCMLTGSLNQSQAVVIGERLHKSELLEYDGFLTVVSIKTFTSWPTRHTTCTCQAELCRHMTPPPLHGPLRTPWNCTCFTCILIHRRRGFLMLSTKQKLPIVFWPLVTLASGFESRK